ncbi:MAG: type II secretion system protein [Sulfurimonas sp.]
MRRKSMRKAIAMIELIFAIVILGIVMMSAPLLINTATQSGYVAMQQESIAIASSEISMIMTHQWDEQGSDENLTTPIVSTGGDTDLGPANDADGHPTGKRAGTLNIETQRSFFTTVGSSYSATLPVNFKVEADFDDIDDFHNTTSQVSVYNNEDTDRIVGEVGDVADINVTLLSTIRYMSDAPDAGSSSYQGSSDTLIYSPFGKATPATTSNIKHVNVTLTTNSTDADLNKTIILNAFSCNIGSYELEERSFF